MRPALAACLAFALAACVGPNGVSTTVTHQTVSPLYYVAEANAFAGAGAQTVIFGTTADGADSETIASSMRLPPWFSQRELTLTDDPEGLHLALVFAPSGGVSAHQACRGDVSAGRAGPDLKVFGVYCFGDGRPANSGRLQVAGSPVPGTPQFERAMRRLFTVILPANEPDGGECVGAGC